MLPNQFGNVLLRYERNVERIVECVGENPFIFAYLNLHTGSHVLTIWQLLSDISVQDCPTDHANVQKQAEKEVDCAHLDIACRLCQ